MVARRVLLVGLSLVVVQSLAAVGQSQDPQPPPTTGDASLKETLLYGLRPRTPEDEAFIDMVVAKTEAKVLPLDLVVSTYRYAKNKRPFPFPYFERALRVRARQIGIEI